MKKGRFKSIREACAHGWIVTGQCARFTAHRNWMEVDRDTTHCRPTVSARSWAELLRAINKYEFSVAADADDPRFVSLRDAEQAGWEIFRHGQQHFAYSSREECMQDQGLERPHACAENDAELLESINAYVLTQLVVDPDEQ